MPILGLLAPLWYRAPTDPDEMMEWPADYVYQMLWYVGAEVQIQRELNRNA